MLIDFSNKEIREKQDRDIKRVYQRDCILTSNLEEYEQFAELNSDNVLLNYHVERVLSAREFFKKAIQEKREKAVNKDTSKVKTRGYVVLGAGGQDSHNEIEKLGVVEYFRNIVVLVSLETRLDYILHRITGCPSECVRQIPNYLELSRAILACDWEELERFTFRDLASCSPKVEAFIQDCRPRASSNPNEKIDERMNSPYYRFFGRLYTECANILNYIAVYLPQTSKLLATKNANGKESKLVIRSFGFANIVFTANDWPEDEPKELLLQDKTFEPCTVKVHTLQRMEYLDVVRRGEIL